MCPDTHPHNMNCYRHHHCRCDTCRGHRSNYVTHRNKQIAYGRWKPLEMVDARPARLHCNALLRAGWTVEGISKAAEADPATVKKILRPGMTVKDDVAKRVMAVDVRGAVSWLPTRGVKRRVEALATLGYSRKVLSLRIGWNHTRVGQLMEQEYVTADVFKKIADVYEELCMTPAPESRSSQLTRSNAAKQGFAPPLSWKDIDMDREPVMIREVA